MTRLMSWAEYGLSVIVWTRGERKRGGRAASMVGIQESKESESRRAGSLDGSIYAKPSLCIAFRFRIAACLDPPLSAESNVSKVSLSAPTRVW
jgi:hypothetical protein